MESSTLPHALFLVLNNSGGGWCMAASGVGQCPACEPLCVSNFASVGAEHYFLILHLRSVYVKTNLNCIPFTLGRYCTAEDNVCSLLPFADPQRPTRTLYHIHRHAYAISLTQQHFPLRQTETQGPTRKDYAYSVRNIS